MTNFDLQGVEIHAPFTAVFRYIADPSNLPAWTNAFSSVSKGTAVMNTPEGPLEIGLSVETNEAAGTVDWKMTMPDGASAHAFSRVVPLGTERCLYNFVLPPPPGSADDAGAMLEQQSQSLREELARLPALLERK